MRHTLSIAIPIVALLLACAVRAEDEVKYNDRFNVDPKNFSSTGKSKYFVLEPGYQLVLEGMEKGKKTVLIVNVTNNTKVVDNVETRVVEERETQDGELAEVALNYFAMDKTTGDLYYFGEDVDTYKDGKVDNHDGTWYAGVNGAKYGMLMPGSPKPGDAYYQELAGNIAQDRAAIVSVTEKVETPTGTYSDCVKTKETTPLEPKFKEFKAYAPGIGLVDDDGLKLVKIVQAAK